MSSAEMESTISIVSFLTASDEVALARRPLTTTSVPWAGSGGAACAKAWPTASAMPVSCNDANRGLSHEKASSCLLVGVIGVPKPPGGGFGCSHGADRVQKS
jgi:hypothetical protein